MVDETEFDIMDADHESRMQKDMPWCIDCGAEFVDECKCKKPTAGELAYNAELRVAPLYFDGSERPKWEALHDVTKESWERNPVPRYK